MISFEHLSSDSTLGDLPLNEISVHQETPSRVIAELLEENSSLPGILVEDHRGSFSFISRQRFRERMNCPLDLDIFLKSSIATFLEKSQKDRSEMLVLSCTEKISTSVQMGLGRSPDHCYDPIIVISEDENLPGFQTRSLLDFHTLLLAQSHIITQANQQLQHQKLDAQRSLEHQQKELMVQSQEIAQLKQQFLDLSQILSEASQSTFQATFAGIHRLCQNTDQLGEVGNALRNELNTIGSISKAIAKISRQVHHLSVKASIIISQSTLVNSSHDSLAGFSTINEEIGNLVSQTFDAGRQIEQVSTEFRQRIEAFVYTAQEGMSVSRSLLALAEEAEGILHRLEEAVNRSLLTGRSRSLDSAPKGVSWECPSLEKISGQDPSFSPPSVLIWEGVV